MSSSVPAEKVGAGVPRALPLYRLGDLGLALFLGIAAASRGAAALDALRADEPLVAAHQAIIGLAMLINGALCVLRGPAVVRGIGWQPKVIAFVGSYAGIPLALLPLTWESDWLMSLTIVGLIGTYVFVIWALLTLRRNFSVFPEARSLVRHGPYGLVRHPLYAAYIAGYVLVALPRLGPLAILFAGLGIAGEVLRARYEERLLARTFPDYADYAATTPRFLPRVRGKRGRSAVAASPAATDGSVAAADELAA